jgi:hypothetical protein
MNCDISFGLVVSQEMMSDVYVLCSRVVYGIVCHFNGTLIVTKKGESWLTHNGSP